MFVRTYSKISNPDSSVKMANFLKEQRNETLRDLEDKGQAYYDANNDVFACCMSAEVNIDAAPSFQYNQNLGKPDGKMVSLGSFKKNAQRRGNTNQCKHCNNKHGDNKMC